MSTSNNIGGEGVTRVGGMGVRTGDPINRIGAEGIRVINRPIAAVGARGLGGDEFKVEFTPAELKREIYWTLGSFVGTIEIEEQFVLKYNTLHNKVEGFLKQYVDHFSPGATFTMEALDRGITVTTQDKRVIKLGIEELFDTVIRDAKGNLEDQPLQDLAHMTVEKRDLFMETLEELREVIWRDIKKKKVALMPDRLLRGRVVESGDSTFEPNKKLPTDYETFKSEIMPGALDKYRFNSKVPTLENKKNHAKRRCMIENAVLVEMGYRELKKAARESDQLVHLNEALEGVNVAALAYAAQFVDTTFAPEQQASHVRNALVTAGYDANYVHNVARLLIDGRYNRRLYDRNCSVSNRVTGPTERVMEAMLLFLRQKCQNPDEATEKAFDIILPRYVEPSDDEKEAIKEVIGKWIEGLSNIHQSLKAVETSIDSSSKQMIQMFHAENEAWAQSLSDDDRSAMKAARSEYIANNHRLGRIKQYFSSRFS